MSNLDTLIKQVHAEGFNISVMINLFKKREREHRARRIVPNEVYCAVCLEYLKRHEAINKSFPYFMKVLNMKADQHIGKQVDKDAKDSKFGGYSESIKSIMNRA